MALIKSRTELFLVIYGGASPEQGPLADVVYARVPNPESVGLLLFLYSFITLLSNCYYKLFYLFISMHCPQILTHFSFFGKFCDTMKRMSIPVQEKCIAVAHQI